MHVLVVEDDALLGDALQAGLRERGFAVDWVRDGIAADTALRTTEFAAVVLDLGLPRRDGLDVLKSARGRGNAVPVLILTARDAVDQRVAGLDAGADDYLVKPAALDELAARLRALIRRSHGRSTETLRALDIILDPRTRRVVFRGREVELNPREFELLRELMLSQGRVLTREQIESRLYEWGEPLESNAIEVFVHHLRRKLAPEVIRTIRGVGYLMPADEDERG